MLIENKEMEMNDRQGPIITGRISNRLQPFTPVNSKLLQFLVEDLQ